MIRARLAAFLLAGTCVTIAVPALGGPATDAVQSKHAAIFALLEKPGGSSQLAPLIDDALDHAHIAEASLGPEWGVRSDAEKQAYGDLMKQLARRDYQRQLEKSAGQSVAYLSETAGSGWVAVLTKTTPKAEARTQPFEVAYKLAQRDGKWRIQDYTAKPPKWITLRALRSGNYRSSVISAIHRDRV